MQYFSSLLCLSCAAWFAEAAHEREQYICDARFTKCRPHHGQLTVCLIRFDSAAHFREQNFPFPAL
jgi:hypothetical protein